MQSHLVGVWTLRSFHMENVETRERSQPFGPEPRGALILHPDGRMMAMLTPGGQKASAAEADQAASSRKLVAYSGLYRLEPPDRLVTSVDVAWFADWIGTEQVRTFTLEGDRLELVTPPGRMPRQDGGEVTVIGILAWTREAPTPVEAAPQVSG